MITNISLTNFRGFEEQVSVRIRPITILIGRNSAGKSTVIKFLQMLRQTLESQRDEFFVTDGKYVQLGSWPSLKNNKSNKRYFQFSIDVATTDIPTAEVQQMWETASKKGVVTEIGDKIRLALELTKSPVVREVPVAKFRISGQVPYYKKLKSGRHAVSGVIEEINIFNKAAGIENAGFLRFGRRTDSLNDMIESVAAEQFLAGC